MADHAVRLNDRFAARARALACAVSVLLMVTGALALAGWLLDLPVLAFSGGIIVKANTALSLLLAGASLGLLCAGQHAVRSCRLVGQALALLVGAIGAATLSQHVFGWDLGIDRLLADEAPGALATTSPGRMGPPASVAFVLAGAALLLLHARKFFSLAQLAAVCIGLLALLAITGYAYGAESLYGVARFTGIALYTAIALLALSVGLIASSIEHGIASVMAGDGAGSLMARRLLVLAIVVPLLLGWVRVWIQDRAYVETRFGIAVLILAIIVIMAIFVIHSAIVLDRVERQQLDAEAKLRDRLQEIETMMEVLPVAVFIAPDPSGTQIRGNRAAREFLRLPCADGGLSLSDPLDEPPVSFRVVQGGIEVPSVHMPVRRAARDGVAIHGVELEIVFADGLVKHELISALPLLDEHGNARGAIASMLDITADKAAGKEREHLLAREQEARGQADAANRAKDAFIASISHELRTPLHAILGWTAILREGRTAGEPARQKALAIIERNCKAQAQLLEDLLDVSRIVAGNLRLDCAAVDLVGIVNAAVDAVRPTADGARMQLRQVLEDDSIRVRGDPMRLQQVVWNLLANAVKFSPKGGSVEIRLAAGTSAATIVVVDTGEGIAAEILPHIFDRFRQADGVMARRHDGLGLGLTIVRSLVEMHGGTIHAESAGIGRGASFTVRLPLLQPDGKVAPVSDSAA